MILRTEDMYLLEVVFPGKEEMSDDEFYAFCQANQHVRMERDEKKQIIIMPPTGGETANQHTEFLIALGKWNKEKEGGKIFDSSTGFTLPDGSIRSPDVSWIPLEKWESLSPKQKQRFLPFAPDFLVEVLSPTDHLQPAQDKMHN